MADDGRTVPGPTAPSRPAELCEDNPGSNLGRVAYLWRGRLMMRDVMGCAGPRTLVGGGAGPGVRFSPDGSYVGYGAGRVVNIRSGSIERPVGEAVPWAWTGSKADLAGVTGGGGLLTGRPGRLPVRRLPEGWGASAVIGDAHTSRLIVARLAGRGHPRAELWVLDARSGERHRFYRAPPPDGADAVVGGLRATLTPLRLTPDRHSVVFWSNPFGSASLAADGVHLQLVPLTGALVATTLAPAAPAQAGLLDLCGNQAVYVSGGGRDATVNKELAAATGPAWTSRTIAAGTRSFGALSCRRRAVLAATSANRQILPGREHRRLELHSLGTDRARVLTSPPTPRFSDEAPRLSRDGRWAMFVRSGPTRAGGDTPGALYLIRIAHRPVLVGPIARLGPGGVYYGSYDWPERYDWYEPRQE
jgi:hypothetical protein